MIRALAIAILLVAGSATTALAELELAMTADRTSVAVGEQLRIQITVASKGADSPEIQLPSFEGFEVLSQQVQRPMQFSFSFGSRAVVQSSTIYRFVLSPTHVGTLRIDPVRVEVAGQSYVSKPLDIKVSGAPGQAAPQGSATLPDDPTAADVPEEADDSSALPGAAARPQIDAAQIDPVAFVRTVVDKANPFVGEQITATIYLYVRQRLQSSPSIDSEPTADGFWTHDLLGPGYSFKPTRQVVNGNYYYVYVLRRFAAFPLRSGELQIGPLSLSIDTSSVFDLFGGRRGDPIVKRSGVPIALEIRQLPEEGAPAQGGVAVGRYTLTSELDRGQVVAGDAVTLTAVVSGRGNVRTVTLETPKVQGAEVLAPQTREQVDSPKDLLGGTREFRWLIVASEPGRLTIPGLTLHTFEPGEGYKTLQTDPLTLEVVGEAGARARTGDTSADSPAEPEQADRDTHQFGPIRTQSALLRARTPLLERAFFPWALVAPGLVWLFVVVTASARRRMHSRASSGPLRALRDAERRLSSAERAAHGADVGAFYASAEAALLGVLEAKLGEGMRGLTHGQLRAQLSERGMSDELRAQTVQWLERSEYARFGQSDDSGLELAEQLGALRALFRRLQAWQPAAEEDAA